MSMKKKLVLARKIAMGLIIAANSCMAGAFAAPVVPAENALPQGESVAFKDSGDVKFSQSGNQLDINQTAGKAIINWSSFDIGKNATVNFNHMTAAGAMNPAGITLNRVTGENMSQIYGNINAIGSIILINPNGAIFAEGSQVNAAGIIVSTEDMGGETQENFKNGTYVWHQNPNQNNNISIMGSLNASTNGKYLTEGAYANHLNNNVLTIKGLQPATGFSYGNNKIMLIADGDVAVGEKGQLIATTTTNIVDDGSGETSRQGAIILRADQNADDVAKGDASLKIAKVYLNNESADQIQGLNVSVYYNSDVTGAGINGTNVSDIGVYSTNSEAPTTFTQKDYTKIGDEVAKYKAKVMQTGLTTYNNVAGTAENTQSTGDIQSQTYASLINDVYQLQAIQDVNVLVGKGNETLPQGKTDYYGNLSGSYALGKNIQAADTANWVNGENSTAIVGFNPIGGDVNYNPFKGEFTGNGGSNSYGIYDLNINRKSENSVGLFSSTDNADISSLSLIDPIIKGNYNVGSIVGYSNNSFLDGVTVRKRYKAADGEETKTKDSINVNGYRYVGGLIGYTVKTATRNCTNGAYINGDAYVGGLIGYGSYNRNDDGSETSMVIYKGKNLGWYSPEENLEKGYKYGVVSGADEVGGLIGQLYYGTVDESYSNGQVSGTGGEIGGLASTLEHSKLINSYNSNEAYPLSNIVSKPGDYFDNGDVMGSGTSVYGLVKGKYNVGGVAGYVSDSTIDNVYNAGNVTGMSEVGGLVGKMGYSEIKNSYNGDRNTMYQSAANAGEQYGFIINSSGTPVKYVYNLDSGNWTSYIYQDSQWAESGSGYTTSQVSELAPESERLYLNRPAYRDAVVTGEKHVGGLVGLLNNYNYTDRLENNYNAGRINYSSNYDSLDGIGGLVGYVNPYTSLTMPKANEDNGNFMVTTQNVTGKNVTGAYTDASGEPTTLPVVGNVNSYSLSDYEKTLWDTDPYKVEPPPYVKPDVKPTPDEKPDVKPTPDVKPDVKPTPDVNPVIPDNKPRYDIDFLRNDAGYGEAKKARRPMYIGKNGQMVFNNAYVPESLLTSRRFTLEDTGVHLYDNHLDNSIVIDKSSRADGGDTITIKRKAVVINNITMAE